MKPMFIAIAGGSASGKTTVVNEIIDRLGKDDITVISYDDYYKDLSHLTMEERKKVNYDHPDSFDDDLLFNNLTDLIEGRETMKPLWDFANHTRKPELVPLQPKRIIILEGILVLNNKKIRDLSDVKIFVKCDEDLRFIRRLSRDIAERGRTTDDVIAQYLATVKPMFNSYVRPSSKYADIIIPNDNKHDVALEFIISRIKDILHNWED